VRLARVIRPDHAPRGAVVTFDGRWYRRGEPGPAGPLILAAASDPGGTTVEVWGPAATPGAAAEHAVETAAGWAGLRDDLTGVAEVLTPTAPLRRLVDAVGEVRLGRTPRVGEALGRSIIEQLVQGKEARRSIAQLVARSGTRVDDHRWHWPTARDLGSTPVWELRRCGVSGRMATALHAAAVEDARLERVRHDWQALDRRLRALPGVGPWTSAETRLRLGDPDAVSVGDYHLPTTVGYALSGPDGDGPDGTWTDAGMLELLAPYAGQRGRVIRLVETAAAAGLVARRQRRGPRAALSAHRYW
jgi:3-methyladenine DNA glycosylase/8-oxoguanine DNA glycosylase